MPPVEPLRRISAKESIIAINATRATVFPCERVRQRGWRCRMSTRHCKPRDRCAGKSPHGSGNAWAVFCPRCILHDIQSGSVSYERSLWRLATRTVYPTHRCGLRMAKNLPSTAEQCEWLIEPMTELELAVIDELIRFERLVAAARRGSTIKLVNITLVAQSFVSIFRDLTPYCITNWDTRDYRRVCLVERQVMRLGGYVTRLFNRERKHRTPRRGRDEHQDPL
jgi:hypothetical protein